MAAKAQSSRKIILCTDGGLQSNFAFNYYCNQVHKRGDFVVLLFCPHIEIEPGEDLGTKDVAVKLGDLVLNETHRVYKDAKKIGEKLKQKNIDGKVIVASAPIAPKISIIDTSEKENADLIILGARRLGKGLQQQGTTKQHVVRRSQVPVLICKHGKYTTTRRPREGVKRLVVGGSDCGMHSLEGLTNYRNHIYRDGDYMLLVYVPVTRTGTEQEKKKIKAITNRSGPAHQDELQKLFADNASLLTEFITNDLQMPGEVFMAEPDSKPGDALLEVAEREGADLIVVGARGLSEEAFQRSSRTSDKVANDSEVTVFINKF